MAATPVSLIVSNWSDEANSSKEGQQKRNYRIIEAVGGNEETT